MQIKPSPILETTALYDEGRTAAALLWRRWRNPPEVVDPQDAEFARGALDEIVARLLHSDDVDKEMREHSEAAAEQLTKPNRAIYEFLQNADDLQATSVTFSVRRRGRGELLIAHNGSPVVLRDVIAMTLAFLSTKRGDELAKGRFGIGLKTLNQIGSRLSVHSPPYHFSICRGMLERVEPYESIKDLYEKSGKKTLFVLSLDQEFTVDDILNWIRSIDESHLLFFDCVRSISLLDGRAGKVTWNSRLDIRSLPSIEVELRPGVKFSANRVVLTDPSRPSRTWTRYSIDYPVPDGHKRAHKAIGRSTTLSVAVSERAEPGLIAAGTPLDIRISLPICMNAQFDPDLSRRGLLERTWNSWLFARLADLSSGVALLRFQEKVVTGWQAVPLPEENWCDDHWVREQLDALVDTILGRVRSKLRLRIGGRDFRLRELAYEAPELEGVLSSDDQRHLASGQIPLPKSMRDAKGRWRHILDAMEQCNRIEVSEALRLLGLSDEELGARPTAWFIAFADAALSAGLENELSAERSIVADDGSRYSPNGEVLLVRHRDTGSIASRLSLERRVAPDYFSRATPDRVKAWLRQRCLSPASDDPASTLSALARRSADKSLIIDDKTLLLLREALQKVDELHRPSLAAAIGKVIAVDGYVYENEKKTKRSVRPAAAYLPTPIAKDTSGWASAAKTTEGIQWIDPRYVTVLRRGRTGEAGVRRFFVLLGAGTGPRLESRADGARVPINSKLPAAQADALNAMAPAHQPSHRPTHLKDDWLSPDLKRVIADIARRRVDRKRRARARALFDTLAREWERLEEHAEAQAVYHYYRWHRAGTVPTTWMAEVASEPWLSNKAGKKAAPREVAIENATMRLTRGKNKSQYVHELTEADSATPLISALGIKGTPPASELIDELKALKAQYGDTARQDDVRPLYAALATLIPREGVQSVGDVSAAELRRAFEGNGGLLLTSHGWLSPKKVFRGRPIFGPRHAFVPEHRQLVPLWQLLRIGEPDVEDCLDVLEDIGAKGTKLGIQEQGVIVDVLYHLSKQETHIKRKDRRRLAALPLWSTRGWLKHRPIYAVVDRSLEGDLANHLPLWLPGCAIKGLGALPDFLGVQVLEDSAFEVARDLKVEAVDPYIPKLFGATVTRLHSQLAEKGQSVWAAVNWAALEKLELIKTPTLVTHIDVQGQKVSVARKVHVQGVDRLYFVDGEDLGRREVGGHVVASLFTNEPPDMLDYAWAHAWREAEDSGYPEEGLELAINTAEDDTDPLRELEASGKKASGKRLFAGGALRNAKQRGRTTLFPLPKPRRLKNYENATIAEVAIVEPDKQVRRIQTKRRPLIVEPVDLDSRPAVASLPSPVKDWDEREREDRGFNLLAAALKQMNDIQIGDFRALKRLGADSIDDLKRYFELKAHTGEAPDEVRLEPSQFERAVKAGKDYFLAVVSGMEEGKPTQIRIFTDPIRTLPWRLTSTIKLGGIRSSRALVVSIDSP